MEKKCFVVERKPLAEAGFIADDNSYKYTSLKGNENLAKLLRIMEKYGSFRARFGEQNVENDKKYKQIIPYIFVQDHQGKFLTFQRSTSSANYKEARLRGKVSLGIGGHIDVGETLDTAMLREFNEEAELRVNDYTISFEGTKKGGIESLREHVEIEYAGLLDAEVTSVDRVHLGTAVRIQLSPSSFIAVRQGENSRYEYVTPEEYVRMRDNKEIITEGWADMVFKKEILRKG